MRFFVKFSLFLFLGFLASELLLRLFGAIYPYRTELVWRDDDLVGRRLVSSQEGWYVAPSGEYRAWVSVNGEGWRDEEHDIHKPERVYRILFLGDSFVENFQAEYEESLHEMVEENLDALGQEVEVVSMGLGDSGTAQQYLILKEYGLAYSPDLVVHFFYNGNDVVNNSSVLMGDPYRPYFALKGDGLELVPFSTRTESVGGRVKSALKNNFRLGEILFDVKGRVDRYFESSSGVPAEYRLMGTEYEQEYVEAWGVTEELLGRTRDLAKDAGSEYLLVSIPSKEQVSGEIWDGLVKRYPTLESADRQKVDFVLSGICERAGLECVFAYRDFVGYGGMTHFPKDGHLTEVGNEILSEMVVESIEELFLDDPVAED